QLLIGNGTGYSVASLTAGTNISIVPGAGSITINSTSTQVDAGSADNQTLRWDNTANKWVPNTSLLATSTGVVTVGTASNAASVLLHDGNGQTATLSLADVAANRIYTIPEVGNNASFVMTEGAQTVNGVKTYGNNANFNANVGIGTTAGTNALTVSSASDPLKLVGLQLTSQDTLLVVDATGVVSRRAASSIAASTAWSLVGNGSTNPATNFLGTTDNQPLLIKTNGTERIRVLANGGVGIGTATNSYGKVQINDNSTTSQYASFAVVSTGAATGANAISFGLEVSKQAASNTNVGGFFIASGGTNNYGIVVDNGGDVYLGHTQALTPAPLLNSILPNGNPNRTYVNHLNISGELVLGAAGAGTVGQVLISQGAVSAPTWVDQSTLIGNNAWMLEGNAVTTEKTIGTTSNFALPFITNNTERMRLTANGRLGIGTNAPGQLVEVFDGNILLNNSTNTAAQLQLAAPRTGVGTVYTSAFQAGAQTSNITYTLPTTLTPSSTVTNGIMMTDNSGNLSWVTPAGLASSTSWSLTGNTGTTAWNGTTGNFIGTTDTQPFVIATTNASAQDIRFYTGANGASEAMRITGEGNVAIGTTSSSNALTVSAASNPLKLVGVQNNASADTVLTINTSGVVEKKAASAIVSSGMIKGIYTPGAAGTSFTITVSGDIATNAIVNVTLYGSAGGGVIPVMVTNVNDVANTITVAAGASIDNTYKIHYIIINP
ncbi:MAG: hypothetical protein JNJ85_00625, partial [Candidatus Kapabacteria bacterium]|nr:hypothetical protein [Candidatus Kapabacteria bacterium]